MSNEHEHDTHESTGARLSEAQVAYMIEHAQYWLRYQQNRRCNPKTDAMSQLSNNVRALLADRAAWVAEVARLQAQVERKAFDLHAAEAQATAMRPLVEALANSEATEYYGVGTEDTNCNLCSGREDRQTGHVVHEDDCPVTQARALVATWQTPAAPEGGE